MIEIRPFDKGSLEQFIYAQEFRDLEHLPISQHRALSQINNPRAKEGDVLLFVAFKAEQMVGYLGILPDLINWNGRMERCGWMSCIWVNSQYRGQKIASKLVQASLLAWDNRILATEFTAPARRLYDKLGEFYDLDKKEGIRLYNRFDLQTILPPKKKLFKKMKGILGALDRGLNFCLDWRFYLYRKKIPNFKLEFVQHIDEEVTSFIEKKQDNLLFKRSAVELNWIINNPWVLSGLAPNDDSRKYHFSSVDKSFEFIPIKIHDVNQKLVAFMIFTKRNDSFKLPYCYYDDIEIATKIIRHLLIGWRGSTFTVYDKKIAAQLKKKGASTLYKKVIKRNYLIASFFEASLLVDNSEIQDGDGDCCFT